jgi:hypothetical protein
LTIMGMGIGFGVLGLFFGQEIATRPAKSPTS